MKYRVLIVDDEQDFREILTKKLNKRELDCEVAADGEIALKMFKPGKFDVVILDIKMPGKNGIEVLQEIKKIDPMAAVIMLTGHATVETGIDGIKFGAFDYLMKPVNIEQLVERLDAAYQQKRIQEEDREAEQIKKHMSLPS